MLNAAFKKIETAVRKMDSARGAKKAEILRSLAALKAEIQTLSKAHAENARSIARWAETAAHEAARKKASPPLLEHSLKGLALTTQGFEASHPRLVEIVNDLCAMLAHIGI